jgi:malate dehydrogenase (oxaloacetate-decarboxylating)
MSTDSFGEQALARHKQLAGKISITPADTITTKDDLSIYYTPGVGEVSRAVHDNPASARDYTWINNNVAIISDGSAVLGLGNIGPQAALPVMEGKSMLFKQFGGVNAVPIVLDVHSADEIVAAVEAIAPSFGSINLEDIAAPTCFAVEQRLIKDLSIPVMHDDQHGTAIVVLAGLINAAKLTGRDISACKVVIVGAGAAGTAIAELLYRYAQPEIIAVDSKGILTRDRTDLNAEKQRLLAHTNPRNVSGSLADAIAGADVFIGVSKPDLLSVKDVQMMTANPIIFALANPDPEITPALAREAGATVIATGRSDYPNQVNNALVFPGIFRGALDNNVERITEDHKIAVAEAVASKVTEVSADQFIPSIFTDGLADAVAAVFAGEGRGERKPVKAAV